MRFLLALAVSLLITVLVFLFMQTLIRVGQQEDLPLLVHTNVEVLREKSAEPEPEQDIPEEPIVEPIMESLEVSPPRPGPTAKTESISELAMSALDLAVGDIKIKAAGERWSAPLGAAALAAGTLENVNGGENAHGYVEVIPYNTRKPNVPDAAWQNKISGWVLVAFGVTPQGRTRDVRVLDARPRGVFEEVVVAAVSDWQYEVKFYGKSTGNIVLTQKVDVLWESYPQNLPNVD